MEIDFLGLIRYSLCLLFWERGWPTLEKNAGQGNGHLIPSMQPSQSNTVCFTGGTHDPNHTTFPQTPAQEPGRAWRAGGAIARLGPRPQQVALPVRRALSMSRHARGSIGFCSISDSGSGIGGGALLLRRGLAAYAAAGGPGSGGGGDAAGGSAFHEHFARIYGDRWPGLYAALRQPTRHVARVNKFFVEEVVGQGGQQQVEELERIMRACALADGGEVAKAGQGKGLWARILRVADSSLPLCFLGDGGGDGGQLQPQQPQQSFVPPTEARARWLGDGLEAESEEEEGSGGDDDTDDDNDASSSSSSTSAPPPPQRQHSRRPLPYYIMDLASVLAALALDVREGHKVADFCAAPGTRSFVPCFLLLCESGPPPGFLSPHTHIHTHAQHTCVTYRREEPRARGNGGARWNARGERPLQGPQRPPRPHPGGLPPVLPPPATATAAVSATNIVWGPRGAGDVPGRGQVVRARAAPAGKDLDFWVGVVVVGRLWKVLVASGVLSPPFPLSYLA